MLNAASINTSLVNGANNEPLALAGFVYADSVLSGDLTVAVSVSGTLTQTQSLTGRMTLGLPFTGTLSQATLHEGRAVVPTKLYASLQQDTDFYGKLVVGRPLLGRLEQSSDFQASLSSALSLRTEGLLQKHFLTASLTVPALNSTGWLTVSDIFLHNDFYRSVETVKLSASEVSIRLTLTANAVDIMPE